MKIVSWNVNGIRAVAKKGLKESLLSFDADIYCFQETKAQDEQVAEVFQQLFADSSFHLFSNSAVRKGYSGTAIFSKEKPISVRMDIGIEEHDQEGRVIAAEYEHFFLVNVYVPNSGSGLVRLGYRQEWDLAFLNYLKKLEEEKPVILCGDLNVAHQAIDLKNPKSNYNKSAGYMQEEIDGMDRYIASGFVDTYRTLHPEKVEYSWWSYRAQARARNVGWRIDYFLVSEPLMKQVKASTIHKETEGSDHCPVALELSI